MKNKRREFLKNVCPSVALAFFGVTMLEACSSGGEDDSMNSGGSNNNGGGDDNGNNNNTVGYSVSGNTVSITLNNSNFAKLQDDGWMNFTAQNMLLLKIDASTYRAFTNACPHQGVQVINGLTTLHLMTHLSAVSHHGVSYPSDCATSGSHAGGPLNCYTTTLKRWYFVSN